MVRSEHRLHRHRQLLADLGLARRFTEYRRRSGGGSFHDLRQVLPSGQYRRRRGLHLVLRQRDRSGRPAPDTHRRHGQEQAMGLRQKDIRNWWANPHFSRPGGIEAASATAYLPQESPSALRSSAARPSTRGRTSRTSSTIRKARNRRCPISRWARRTIPSSAPISRRR